MVLLISLIFTISFVFLFFFLFCFFLLDNDRNEEIDSNVEFNTFSSATQITGHSEPNYEEVDISDSYYYVNDDQANEERMNTNVAYIATKKIETKTNVAYAAVGGLQNT